MTDYSQELPANKHNKPEINLWEGCGHFPSIAPRPEASWHGDPRTVTVSQPSLRAALRPKAPSVRAL